MTPLFEYLRLLFNKRPGTEQLKREIKNAGCDCPSCIAHAQVFGLRPIETIDEEKAVLLLLLDFADTAPPDVKEVIRQQLEQEKEDGLFIHLDMPVLMPTSKTTKSEEPRDSAIEEVSSIKESATMATQEQVLATLAQALSGGTEFKNTTIEKVGAKIIIPEGMTPRQAIEALQRQQKEDETEVAIDITIDAYPLEGARAFHSAVSEKFGWVDKIPIPGWFGDTPPQMIAIETDVGVTEQVMWGRVKIPAIEGYLQTGINVKDSRFMFRLAGKVRQKHKHLVEEIAALTRQHLKEHSVYKGKALKISFPDPSDEANFSPENCPRFIDTSKTKSESLIYSKDIQEMITTALFNPIECTQECRDLGLSLKRGTLLAGTYGVGKSMAAGVTAKKCVDNGWTFLLVESAEQLAQALLFAKQYTPAVVFVEDVDKVLKGERDKSLDAILNTIDGVDTKNDDIMLVFTTNNLKIINKAALRAKRLDYVIEITPPDADAVKRLIVQYTRGNLVHGETLDEIGLLLAGQIPATLEEVCSRAQLTAVRRMKEMLISGEMKRGDKLSLKESDLLVAGRTMLQQLELVKSESPKTYGNSPEKAAEISAHGFQNGAETLVHGIKDALHLLLESRHGAYSEIPNGKKSPALRADPTSKS